MYRKKKNRLIHYRLYRISVIRAVQRWEGGQRDHFAPGPIFEIFLGAPKVLMYNN